MLAHVFLDRYEPVRLLGEGGMGCVYVARDLKMHRPVVIKVMHAHIAARPEFRERFERETALMARLKHPNAVALLDAATNEEYGPFIVMEHVSGTPLDRLLARQASFSPARLHRLVMQLCDVLAAAHDEKIIHCDLKPANLMVVDFDTPDEKLKVMDFGLARLSEGCEGSGGQARGIDGAYAVGTPGYMPPEQVRGEAVGPWSDLYSVGVILYRLLSGRLPFQGATMMEILLAQAADNPPTFAELGVRSVPFGIEVAVRACLAAAPQGRPGSARELARHYENALLACYEDTEEELLEEPKRQPEPRLRVTPLGPDALVEHLEAWMPEQIAICKLQGFAEAAGGEIVDSQPGLVCFEFREPQPAPKATGLLSWLGLARQPEVEPLAPGIDMELLLRQKTPGQASVLLVTVLLRPAPDGPPPDYAARCQELVWMLRSFLMAQE
ncbi:MAG: serine/threonine protein kinase [Gemmataceae bacterium]|nr:serine/threonine protein kinase [Gemmataceae bacterium]